MQELTEVQLAAIATAYESALMVDGFESHRSGEHAVLISILQRYGLPAGSVMEAYETCERVLYGACIR